MQQFFGYVRVSTAKQGEQGVSLHEQRDAISRYSEHHRLPIASWFEERETAAKRGRPMFSQMLKLLRDGKAQGVIIHKIDRSARNLKDWSDLGELIDAGVDVHFANESLDLHTRGGRLSADIQAVVAADYVRNLREETRKGFYGRIKQGLYPLPAPMGYLDRGKGKLKEVDPIKAPLVRKAFELYATGSFNLDGLVSELFRFGLQNTRGGRISLNGCSVMLNNPFYIGLIRLKRTGETFPGAHQPLVSKPLFDRVQQVLTGKYNARSQRHEFLYRRLLACKHCRYSLIGERQKGHVYYRCHTPNCPTTGLREELVEEVIKARLSTLRFSKADKRCFQTMMAELRSDWGKQREDESAALTLRLGQINDRLNRLTDAFLDAAIDKAMFEQRKAALLMERRDLEEALASLKVNKHAVPDLLGKFLELAGSALLSYEMALPDEKRDLVQILTSNRDVSGKNLDFKLSIPFNQVENRFKNTNGAPYRDRPRTIRKLFQSLVKYFTLNQAPGWASRPSD